MGKNKRIFSGKKRRKLKRGMGILLAMAVVLNTLPLGGLVVSASENKEVGICTHHKQHTKDCSYSPASDDEKGSPCTYECKLCPIEDLIAALPDAVTEDNGAEVETQLKEIFDLYQELSEDEQEQVDLTLCYELQATLTPGNAPIGIASTPQKAINSEGAMLEVGTDFTYEIEGTTYNCIVVSSTKNEAAVVWKEVQNPNSDLLESKQSMILSCEEKGGRLIKFAEYQVLSEHGIIDTNNNYISYGCQEYDVCDCIGGTWRGEDYAWTDWNYFIAFDLHRNSIEATENFNPEKYYDGNPFEVDTNSFTWKGMVTPTIKFYSDMNGTEISAPSAVGTYYIKLFIDKHVVEDGIRYEASESDYIEITILPIITEQPKDAGLYYGYTTRSILSVTTAVDGVAYQWYENNSAIDGATQATYMVPTGKMVGTYQYYCKVSLGDYTEQSQTATVTVVKSGANLEGKVRVLNGTRETKDFTASDTITVIAIPTATGQAPQKAARLRGGFTAPTAGQMALFVGDTQVSDAVDVGEDGTYTMEVTASDVTVVVGGPGKVNLTTKFVGNDNMADAEATVEVTVTAVAQVEKDGEVIAYLSESDFVGSSGVFIENSYAGTTVTLLADVQPGSNSVSGIACSAMVDINCTLDLAGHKFTSSDVAIYILPRGDLTIQDSSPGKTGKVISTNSAAILAERSASLMGGTYIGNPAIDGKNSSTSMGSLLANYNCDSDTHYAYFDVDGNPITNILTEKVLTGPVTVKECTKHIEQKYSHETGTSKHTQTCAACGATEEVDCEYKKSVASDNQVRTKVCDCGATLTASLTDADNLVYNGQDQKPTGVTFMVDGVTLRNDVTNFKTYTGNKDAGTGTVCIMDTQGVFWGQFQLNFPIAQATPKVTWNGGNTQMLTYTGQAATVTAAVHLVNSETGTVSYSYAKQGSNSYTPGLPTDVGTYSVKASFAEQKNYVAAGAELTLTITPLTITVTPDDGQKKEYGKDDPELTYTVSPSLFGNDKLTGTLTYEGKDVDAIGNHEIIQGTLAAPSNYELTVASGVMFEITKPSLENATVTVNGSFTYTGEAQTPTADQVKVTLNGTEIPSDQYTISASGNINAGMATATVTATENGNYSGSASGEFNIAQATPNIGKVTAQELENTLDISKVALKRENQTPDGTLKLIDGSTLQYGTKTYTWEFIPKDTMNYLSITGNVDIRVKDTIPPTAKYQIGTDKWKEFVKTISFGLFCKDYKTVELEFTDDTDEVKGSGIAKKQYYISDKEITEFDNIEWKEYTKTIHLDAKGTYFIYVNVSDNVGNEVILNSEGIVIYEESALSPAAFDYTYKQNQDCTIQLTMNGNTFKTLTDNKGNDISTNCTVENGKLTLKAAYLDTLDKGEYTYKIYMNPQGVETDKKTLVYTFTVKVKAKELTVTGVTATDRDYNGTNVVGITEIALSGIAPDDDVSVDLNAIQGLLSSANAGEYDSVTLPKLTLTGTSKSNYTLVQPTKAVATSVTIEKAATEITVGTSTYNKTFGDGTFTLDVTDNNLEEDVQYKVTAGEDVVSVENGTVDIKSAGIATITVSLQESANYKAATDKTITVDVAKKSGYTVEAVNKSYLYTKENADTIDLAVLLPRDCGMVNYGSPSTSGDVKFETSAVDDGKLSYTLGNGNASDEGTITVIATTQNYEDIKITVNVKLTDKKPVKLKDGTKVTLKNDTLNFGETLSKLIFNEADFVDSDGNKVEGILTWKKEDTTPDAGTTNATWQFLPTNDSEYETLEGIAAITVNKAVPVVDAVPTVTERVYNPSVTLKNIGLTGGMVSVDGSWSWERANIVPSVDNSGYVAVFTPTDKTNYEMVTKTIVVKVTKATPRIKTAPSAAVITYGDALSVSNLAGGVVQYSNDNTEPGYDTIILGSFVWKDDSQKPVVAGSKDYEVVFIPADGANYNSVETTVTLTVLKAENAPNMPNSTMNVLNSCKKVSDVTLPDGWEWQEADKDTDLEVETAIDAVAVYIGADTGNYEKEEVTVAITRTSCDHVAGEILYTGTGEKAPNCTENGLGHRECTKCHSLIESEIVVTAFGHIHTELRGTVGATCMTDGYTGDSYCKDCGVKIADGTATDKLAHNYTSRITKEPTTTEEGVRTYTCMGCGNSYTDTISKLPEQEHKHSYSSRITKEATCAEKGIKIYRCICGDSYTESIPVLNHNYTNWKSDETNHWHECSSCGDKKDTT
ncbi:MAG: hypothetical protein K2N51_12570, partial [Lachnospiraceae bacterium]|nr:hypothetical protein [Lachnospiraceae bacterium]